MRRSFVTIAAELRARYDRSRDPDPARVLRVQLGEEHEACASLTSALAAVGLGLAHCTNGRGILYRLDRPEQACSVCGTPLPPWADWWQCLLRDQHADGGQGDCSSLYRPLLDAVFAAPATGEVPAG